MELPDNQVPAASPIDSVAAEAPQAKSDVTKVKLSVVCPEGDIVNFRVKTTTSMTKLKHSYAEHSGLSTSDLRFFFDGKEVNDEDTPQQLKMEDDDVVDVYQTSFRYSSSAAASRVAKLPPAVRPKTSDIPPSREVQQTEAQNSRIVLKVVGRDFSKTTQFRLKMTDSLKKVKQAYATQLGLSTSDLRFVFHGNLVNDEETPQQLKMKENDVINVYQNQPYVYNPDLASPFDKVPPEVLQQIFARLPLKKRVKLGRTCKQFLAASHETSPTKCSSRNWSAPWPRNIDKLLRCCPKIAEIFVDGRTTLIEQSQLNANPPPKFESLTSLKLYRLYFRPAWRSDIRKRRHFESTMTRYFERFPKLEELVWHHVQTDGKFWSSRGRNLDAAARFNMPAALTVSLRRLMAVNPVPRDEGPDCWAKEIPFNAAFHQMPNLECLYLGGSLCCFDHARCADDDDFWETFLYGLGTLSNLRELCLADPDSRLAKSPGPFVLDLEKLAAVVCEKLPKLEVLIFASSFRVEPAGIARLITAESSLKILVVAGEECSFGKYEKKSNVPFVVPPRSFAEPGTPTLHVFIGGEITRTVRFTKPNADTVKFWVLDCELPEFLAKPDVAQVFEGVWLAKMILEQPSWSPPWDRDELYNDSHSSPLQFCV